MQSKVTDLTHPSRIDQAIAGSQISVRNYVAVMQIDETFQNVADQGWDEHLIEIEIFVGQYVFETATSTVRRQNGHLVLVDRRTDKGDYILVMNLIGLVFILDWFSQDLNRQIW